MNIPAHYSSELAQQLNLRENQVSGTLNLLIEGGTVPFIARYRKEATGSLDEVAIAAIRESYFQRVDIDKRRESIIDSMTKSDQLTTVLKQQLSKASTLTELEDIYLPYKPKRKTRAVMARERGLEPIASSILAGTLTEKELLHIIQSEKEITTRDDALAGARDIIAEKISEDQSTRTELRKLFTTHATLHAKVIKKNIEKGEKYASYFDWQEPSAKAPSHRILAMFRGENEKILNISIQPPVDSALRILKNHHLKPHRWQEEIAQALEDGYQRLLAPSLENELRKHLKARADEEAIVVFSDNLRQLLLAPPLGQKRVLALDPGYRTGAKVVCLDGQGKLLDTNIIFPTHGEKKRQEAAKILLDLVTRYHIDAIAIGNGTGGRETDEFVRSLQLPESIIITLVNEDGASIYSASESARAEFPDQDITVRGAVSIGRRLQDPLAELVKIDPKSIGVGQYQHDVNQTELKKSLQELVESCVNSVGVELNSASTELLTYISGLGKTLAENIVSHRESNSPFKTRRDLLKVARLGPKAFEQCAGFLRIGNSKNPLDNSGVHPERYTLVQQMAEDSGTAVQSLMQSEQLRQKIDLGRYINESTGMPTMIDIMKELAKPGRDPRKSFEQFKFGAGIHSIEDLQEGMQLPAIITNVTKFGAFADIGIKENGLIHISQLADRYIKDPNEIVKVLQKVTVRILEIDTRRKRIALSMKQCS